MTDLANFLKLYQSFGIKCTVYKDGDKQCITLGDTGVNTTTSEKFTGYSGFCSEIEFDNDGKFLTQGFYE